jgi:hypothetical protein
MNLKEYGKERHWPNLIPSSHLLGETDVNPEEFKIKMRRVTI